MKRRTVLPLIPIFLITVLPVSTYADYEKEVLDVVRAFCKLDFEGARLSSRTWNKISPYVAWEEEPGWDVALAIKHYDIGKVVVSRQRAVVTVRYDIARSCPDSFGPTQLEQFERTELILVKQSDSWVIDSKLMYPRVSCEILCNRYNCCE